jgi:hypothetical protein
MHLVGNKDHSPLRDYTLKMADSRLSILVDSQVMKVANPTVMTKATPNS